MSVRTYPYRGISKGIGPFPDSLTEQSMKDGTMISNIMANFRVTGVLPGHGLAALPADVFFGGTDFSDLKNITMHNEDPDSACPTNGFEEPSDASPDSGETSSVGDTPGGQSAGPDTE